ncbi:MAG: preprotein translocase subunit SecE [Candidatus Competibacterales bacterium]
MDLKSVAQPKQDTFKLASAATLLIVAIGAFYYFADALLLVRVIGLLAAVGVAVWIVSMTELGHQLSGFVRDSQIELRKVVWPTRQETLQTSLAVIIMVLIMGVFLWLLDMLLFWIVRQLTG